jgi:hypothetical protein
MGVLPADMLPRELGVYPGSFGGGRGGVCCAAVRDDRL